MGDLIQNKTRTRVFEENKQIKTTPNEWYIRKNAHTPLVSIADFKKVQALKTRAHIEPKHKNPLVGKVKCGKCDYRLSRVYKDRNRSYWSCQSHKTQLKDKCGIYISDKSLTNTIAITLHKYADITIERLSLANAIYKSELFKSKLHQLDKELCDLNNQSTIMRNKLLSLYTDYKNNLINKQDYECIRKDYTNTHSKLTNDIEALTKQINNLKDENKFHKKLDKIFSSAFNTDNNEYIYTLVKEIRVFSSDCIEIDFNFEDSFTELADFVNKWEGLI